MYKLLDTVPASRECSIRDASLLRRGAPRILQDLPGPMAWAGVTHRGPGAAQLSELPVHLVLGCEHPHSSPQGCAGSAPTPPTATHAHIAPPFHPHSKLLCPAGGPPAPTAISPAHFLPRARGGGGGGGMCQPAPSRSFHSHSPACSPPPMGLLEQVFLSRPTWVLGSIPPRWEVPIAHCPGRGVMELEIKGVGATIPDHRHLWGGARSSSSGPEVSAEGWEGWLPGHSHTPW